MADHRSNRRILKAIRQFRDDMQAMVDVPESGLAGVTVSAGGETVEVAKRKESAMATNVTPLNAPARQLVPNGPPGRPDDHYPVPDPDRFEGDFQPAPDLERIAKALISANELAFPFFDNLTVVYLWKKSGGQRSGKATLGKCQKPSGLLRFFSDADFVIWLAADHWTGYRATRWQIEACVFHEMKHVGVEVDEEKGTEKPALIPHDFEAFAAEVTHYGTYLYELTEAAKAFEQLPLWDAGHEAEA